MKRLLSIFAVLFLTISTCTQTQWKVDPAHSSLNFNISHSGISIVNGKFLEYTVRNGEFLFRRKEMA